MRAVLGTIKKDRKPAPEKSKAAYRPRKRRLIAACPRLCRERKNVLEAGTVRGAYGNGGSPENERLPEMMRLPQPEPAGRLPAKPA